MGKKKNTRPRTITLDSDVPPPWVEGVAFRESDLTPFWFGGGQMEPILAKRINYGYARSKGTKSLYCSTRFLPMVGLHPNLQITQYRQILAVDTNTRLIGGSRVSVSAVVDMRVDGKSGDYVRGATAYLYAMEMWNTAGDAEAIGWELLINLIQKERDFFRWPILILTDCDLSRHDKINQRVEPLRGNLFLPPGIELAYASSDSGGELLSTKLMRAADKLAGNIMLEESLALSLEGLVATDSPDFSHFRQWQTNEPVFADLKAI